MKFKLALVLALIPSLALADPQPITLSVQEQQDLLNALGKLPYNEVSPIIQYFQIKQAEAQRAATKPNQTSSNVKKKTP